MIGLLNMLSDNKLSDNNLASELAENRIVEIVIFWLKG